MLSIRLNAKQEWWVSSKIFERFFQTALNSGKLSARLDQFRHMANANGGLDLSTLESSQVKELVAGLRITAEHEVEKLGGVDSSSEDGSYRISLQKFLEATK